MEGSSAQEDLDQPQQYPRSHTRLLSRIPGVKLPSRRKRWSARSTNTRRNEVKLHEIQSSRKGGTSDSITLAQSFAETARFENASIVPESTALQALDGEQNVGVATPNGAIRSLHASYSLTPHLQVNAELIERGQ